MAEKDGHGCMGLRHTYGKGDKTIGNQHEHRKLGSEPSKGKPSFLKQKGKNPSHGETEADDVSSTEMSGPSEGFAGKKHGSKPPGGAVSKPAKKKHGWEGHGNGKPPFKGAAPPIHTQGKRKKKHGATAIE